MIAFRIEITGSRNIAAISHDGVGKLTVEFTTGKKYEYTPVSRGLFLEFVNADSKGEFFAANIKGNSQYDVRKL